MRTSQIAPPPRLLMGPGPISADPRVLRRMSPPITNRRGLVCGEIAPAAALRGNGAPL